MRETVIALMIIYGVCLIPTIVFFFGCKDTLLDYAKTKTLLFFSIWLIFPFFFTYMLITSLVSGIKSLIHLLYGNKG